MYYIRNKIKILFSLKQLNRIFFLLIAISFFFSCGTKKKSRSDVTKLGKLYHNTTSKYNGYFNADVLMDESIATLNDQHQDNYNQVLPIFPYVDAPNPEAVSSSLDEAIKKVTVVVNLHRVSHWTDDCYLLLGQAQYVKRDYESSEESLRYMLTKFDEEGNEKGIKSSKKKKKGKKSSGSKASSSKKKKSFSQGQSKSKKKKKKKSSFSQGQSKSKSKAKSKKKKKKKKSFSQGQSKSKKKKKKKPGSGLKKVTKKPTTVVDTKVETPKTEVEASKAKDAKDKITKKDKKKEEESKIKDPTEKPEKYAFKHRPAYQDAKLWIARTYIERQNYDDAMRYIRDLEESGKTHKDIRRDLSVVKSHYYLKQKKYDDALPHLEQAIEDARKKKEKARYAYIIAQIHDLNDQDAKAYASYEQVLKFNPTYDMEFASRLNLATNAWESGKATAPDVTKTLNKMLKDVKNDEFKDQIYYALSLIHI